MNHATQIIDQSNFLEFTSQQKGPIKRVKKQSNAKIFKISMVILAIISISLFFNFSKKAQNSHKQDSSGASKRVLRLNMRVMAESKGVLKSAVFPFRTVMKLWKGRGRHGEEQRKVQHATAKIFKFEDFDSLDKPLAYTFCYYKFGDEKDEVCRLISLDRNDFSRVSKTIYETKIDLVLGPNKDLVSYKVEEKR